MKGEVGTIYLLCFDRPLSHARHYLGWTTDLDERLARHRRGNGSALMRAVEEAGISWQLARTWSGTRTDERAMKNQRNTPRVCPVCRGWVAKNEPNPWAEGAFQEE